MTKRVIEQFLIEKQGYLKKSPLLAAQAIWKSTSSTLPKTKEEISKDVELVKTVQTNMRLAKEEVLTSSEKKLLKAYEDVVAEVNKPKKRLFFDIEVSPNLVLSWGIGNKVSLSHDSIVQERAIICISYAWEGGEVQSLRWKGGNDKEMVKKFSKILNSADEVVTQNGDRFDIKWFRTRCIYHNVPLNVKFNSIDTLKLAKNGFYFNSNKLDYMGKFLGVGGKIHTDYDLWKDIVLKDCPNAMDKMVRYCEMDVVRLQQVFDKLQAFSPKKRFRYTV
jgi:DNA polymerase elongation subunit (family B)